MLHIKFKLDQTITKSTLVKTALFKGGEPNPKLNDYQIDQITQASKVLITAHLPDMNEAWSLLLTIDAVRRVDPSVVIEVFLPYIPFARQDRVCNPGEALGIAVFAKALNAFHVNAVYLLDPHSDTAVAQIENSIIRPLHTCITESGAFPDIKDFKDIWLVAPDAGAQKKVKALHTALGTAGYIVATKERNLETLDITSTRFDGDVKGKRLLVVDDICDGGRTFIALAKALREQEPASLDLWVTHGIFSYGTEIVTEHYDSVCTTNSFQPTAVGQFDGKGERNIKMNWVRV